MAATPSRSTALALVSIFVGAVLLPRLGGWAQPDRIFALAPGFTGPRGSIRQLLIDTAIAVAAAYSAGLAFLAVGDFPLLFEWPWLAVPIAAAVVLYHVVQGALAHLVVPLV